MKILFVKPAQLEDGTALVIRDPATGLPIPAQGVGVPATPFWRQRLSHGDVVATTEAETAPAEISAKSPRKSKE